MAIQPVRLGHIVHSKHPKRASTDCKHGGFYKAPTTQTTYTVSSTPLSVSWDSSCLSIPSDKVDIFLYSPSSTGDNPRVFKWQNVPYSPGSYDALLNPAWWNSTSTVKLQFNILPAGDLPFQATLPAGPVFAVKYDNSTGIPHGSISGTSTDVAQSIDQAKAQQSSNKGKIAAGVLLPLLAIAGAVLAWLWWSRKKGRKERKRWSEAVDKRMSTISADWKSISHAGAQAAIRSSMAIDAAHRNSSFSFGQIRPMSSASVYSTENTAGVGATNAGYYPSSESGEMTQIRSPGVGLRSSSYSNVQAAQRVSRISFAEQASPRPRPSGESRRSAYERRSVAGQSRAFHQAYIPPVPSVYGHSHTLSMGTTHASVGHSDESEGMSPMQTQGPVALSIEEIRSRMNASDEDVGPALNMMRAQALDLEEQYASMPTLPTPTHAKPFDTHNNNVDDPTLFSASPITPTFPMSPPGGGGGMYSPTSATIANVPVKPLIPAPSMSMSPDDMLRAYAERQKASGAISRVTSPPVGVGRPLISSPMMINTTSLPAAGGVMSPTRGAYGGGDDEEEFGFGVAK